MLVRNLNIRVSSSPTNFDQTLTISRTANPDPFNKTHVLSSPNLSPHQFLIGSFNFSLSFPLLDFRACLLCSFYRRIFFSLFLVPFRSLSAAAWRWNRKFQIPERNRNLFTSISEMSWIGRRMKDQRLKWRWKVKFLWGWRRGLESWGSWI